MALAVPIEDRTEGLYLALSIVYSIIEIAMYILYDKFFDALNKEAGLSREIS